MSVHKHLSKIIFKTAAVFCIIVFTATVLYTPASAQSEQPVDEEYTRLIKEATTKPEFLSPLTDYLPQADGVPTPLDVLGCIAGAPDKLTYYADIIRYMRALADASPNVRVESMGETWEGREMVAVIVTDAANMDALAENKERMARLADPRVVKTEAEADALIDQIIPAYILACNMHSTESGAAEAAMELAYRLAVDENPLVKKIRENMVVLIVPSAEPDGHDKHTDWYYKYNQGVKEYDEITRSPYWGRYAFHDNNRDMITMSQVEMQHIAALYYDWLPIVFQDNHESVPYLFFSSANGPSSFPVTMDSERNLIAWWEVTQMNAFGMPGAHTHDFGNTSWSPNFMASIASNHNAMFHFYETFGNGIPVTMEREVGESRREKAWYRPVPPYEKVLWSLRNNLNYQITGTLLAKHIVASQKEFFLKNFWKRGLESFTKGKSEPPYAYIIPSGQKDPVDTAYLINVLLRQKIEVHQAGSRIKLKAAEFPAGSYIIRLDQPYGNLAQILLETQAYPPDADPAYDDCGWTLGLNMGVDTVEVNDETIFDVPLQPVTHPVSCRGKADGVKKAKAAAYIINHGTINTLLPVRIKLKEYTVLSAEEPFKAQGRDFDAGSLIIPVSGETSNLHQAVEEAAAGAGLDVTACARVPEVPTHKLDVPRIAIFHTWASTQDDGWVRFAFDQLGIPFTSIHKDHVRQGSLRDKFDAIVFSNSRGRSGADIVFGIDPEDEGPLAYVQSDPFKHLGTPDASPDITGGMGLEGVLELKRFVEAGGQLILLQNSVRVALDFGFVRGLNYASTSSQFHNPGSLLKCEVVNETHPIAYGYDKEPAVLRRHSGPLLSVPDDMEKHVILRYAEEGDVCLSGIVKGEKDIKGKAAILDVPLGQGRVVMFTFNPFWRDTNHGVYAFVFNALLNAGSGGWSSVE
jgi:hypothetical protein